MSQRKKRRKPAGTDTEAAANAPGSPQRLETASRHHGRAGRFTIPWWRNATRVGPWLKRAAVVWSLVAAAQLIVFYWQRWFPVGGIWVSTADLYVIEPVGSASIESVRMAFLAQVMTTYACLFVAAPLLLAMAVRRAGRQLSGEMLASGCRSLAVGYAVWWAAFLLVAASWFLPFNVSIAGWVAGLPLILAGQPVDLPLDGRVVWLTGTLLGGASLQFMLVQWISKLWVWQQRDGLAEEKTAAGAMLTSMVVAALALPVLYAMLVYWAMTHWLASGGHAFVT